MWNLPTDHLSPSQVGMYLRCGHQYEQRYVFGRKLPPGIAMARGRGVHRGAESRHRMRMKRDIELPRDDQVDAAVSAYDDCVKDGILLNEDERARGQVRVVADGRDATARLSGLYADEVAPHILRPVAVEERLTITVPRMDLELVGILDLAHELNDRLTIEDLKTGKKRWSEEQLADDIQLDWYAMAWRHRTGSLPDVVGVRQCLDQKKPSTAWLGGKRSDADVRRLLKTVNAVARGISMGVFTPAQPGAWWCSSKWCGYWKACPYRGGRT